jgi:hypothetical protein
MKTAFIISSTIIFPQLKNGSFLVGGGFTGMIESLDNSYYTEYDYTSKWEGDMKEFTFFPNAGYFVLKNIVVGLTARIGLTDSESNYSNTSKNTEYYFRYGIGTSFRYYYPVGDFAFIGELKYELT